MTPERLPHIEYLSVTLLSRGAFVFRNPSLSHVKNIVYLPFSDSIWICSITLVVIGTTIIFITYKFSNDTSPRIFSSDFLLFAISALCQMDGFLVPRRASAKMATYVFYLCLIFVYTSYTANIVALLQSTSKSIRTLADLLNSNIELGVEDSPYLKFFFSAETEPIRKKIYDTKIAPQNKPPDWVNDGCGQSRLLVVICKFYFWFLLLSFLFRIREHGIQEIEKARRYTSRPICSSQSQNFESVGIIECYAAFLVLCYGIAAALGFLCLEHFWKIKTLLLHKDS
ncbi:uncharacterized protein LOC116342265 [Contarinia nasturtii]|uniref:uncharacterized protein LOC116342265 n=1 Tax=Contarinia nasturtii TaxID=265458 RepID=UPI0012D402EB|nr:uncharacterized protein LOC116342265 [Contarinia nasturtii]